MRTIIELAGAIHSQNEQKLDASVISSGRQLAVSMSSAVIVIDIAARNIVKVISQYVSDDTMYDTARLQGPMLAQVKRTTGVSAFVKLTNLETSKEFVFSGNSEILLQSTNKAIDNWVCDVYVDALRDKHVPIALPMFLDVLPWRNHKEEKFATYLAHRVAFNNAMAVYQSNTHLHVFSFKNGRPTPEHVAFDFDVDLFSDQPHIIFERNLKCFAIHYGEHAQAIHLTSNKRIECHSADNVIGCNGTDNLTPNMAVLYKYGHQLIVENVDDQSKATLQSDTILGVDYKINADGVFIPESSLLVVHIETENATSLMVIQDNTDEDEQVAAAMSDISIAGPYDSPKRPRDEQVEFTPSKVARVFAPVTQSYHRKLEQLEAAHANIISQVNFGWTVDKTKQRIIHPILENEFWPRGILEEVATNAGAHALGGALSIGKDIHPLLRVFANARTTSNVCGLYEPLVSHTHWMYPENVSTIVVDARVTHKGNILVLDTEGQLRIVFAVKGPAPIRNLQMEKVLAFTLCDGILAYIDTNHKIIVGMLTYNDTEFMYNGCMDLPPGFKCIEMFFNDMALVVRGADHMCYVYRAFYNSFGAGLIFDDYTEAITRIPKPLTDTEKYKYSIGQLVNRTDVPVDVYVRRFAVIVVYPDAVYAIDVYCPSQMWVRRLPEGVTLSRSFCCPIQGRTYSSTLEQDVALAEEMANHSVLWGYTTSGMLITLVPGAEMWEFQVVMPGSIHQPLLTVKPVSRADIHTDMPIRETSAYLMSGALGIAAYVYMHNLYAAAVISGPAVFAFERSVIEWYAEQTNNRDNERVTFGLVAASLGLSYYATGDPMFMIFGGTHLINQFVHWKWRRPGVFTRDINKAVQKLYIERTHVPYIPVDLSMGDTFFEAAILAAAADPPAPPENGPNVGQLLAQQAGNILAGAADVGMVAVGAAQQALRDETLAQRLQQGAQRLNDLASTAFDLGRIFVGTRNTALVGVPMEATQNILPTIEQAPLPVINQTPLPIIEQAPLPDIDQMDVQLPDIDQADLPEDIKPEDAVADFIEDAIKSQPGLYQPKPEPLTDIVSDISDILSLPTISQQPGFDLNQIKEEPETNPHSVVDIE